jgi:hypothetical protein
MAKMWIFPALGSVVALAFAGMLARRYLDRRRPPEILWSLALLMYAVASAALALGAGDGWATGEYRAYWLFGAVLTVPFLAMGEVYLLVKRRLVADALLLVLAFFAAFALNRIRTATLVATALEADLPRGSRAWANDPFVLDLARIYSFAGFFILLGGTLWSAWSMRSAGALRNRFLGTLGIAIGATVVAAGSGFAATGNLVGFSLMITAGVAVMFWGFRRASRPSADRPPARVGTSQGE